MVVEAMSQRQIANQPVKLDADKKLPDGQKQPVVKLDVDKKVPEVMAYEITHMQAFLDA